MTYSYDFAVIADTDGHVYLQCGEGDCIWEHRVGRNWSESTLSALQVMAARHLIDHDGAFDGHGEGRP